MEDQNTNKPKILGALNKALVRTFRGDLSQKLETQDPQTLNQYLPPTPEQPKEKKDAIVHTLSDDVTRLVRNDKMSIVRMAALESDKQQEAHERAQKDPWKVVLTILLVVLITVVVGVVGVGGFYAYRLNSNAITAPQDNRVLFTEGSETVDFEQKSTAELRTLFSGIRTARNFFILGSMTHLNLVETPKPQTLVDRPVARALSIQDVFARFEWNAPDTFLATLGSEYLFGVYAIDAGNTPFLVLTSTSYGYTFNGLHDWEDRMPSELIQVFTDLNARPQPTGFVDEVHDNLDVRVLYDTNGNVMLVYGFVNRTTVAITTDIKTFLEIASRVSIAR